MTSHQRTMIKMISIFLLIIVTSISLGKCAPAVTKSLAPIWLPNDAINGNRDSSTGLWNTKSSETTTNSDIKSDVPTIRHVSSIPVEEDMYDADDWRPRNLPFSILYVNTLRRRLASRSMANLNNSRRAKGPKSITTTTKPATTRPTMRSKGQRLFSARYPLVPELFMSYGWTGWGN